MRRKITNMNCIIGALLFSLAIANSAFAQKPGFKTDARTGVPAGFVAAKADLSNPLSSKIYRDGEVTVIEMTQDFLYPASIDATGKKVVIQTFGFDENTYFWSMETGITTFPGLGTDVNSNGIIAGDFIYDGFPGGVSAMTGGTYNSATGEWTFLGMNPDYPEINPDGYNSVWGMSDDGATIVGMQLGADWSATAFKWTTEGGYNNIGASLEYDSRASGVSRNGEVVYGWATDEIGYWMPIAWHNNTYTLLITDEDGEASCASPEGTYVAGHTVNNAFLWSEAGGLVTFGSYEDFPTIAMEDGGVFGFTGVFPPDVRRAFYKDPSGIIIPFNDYAEARGMKNAQAWTFYSVNDVTPDGNKFIGSGINLEGQDVCFLIDFSTFVNTDKPLQTAVSVYPNPTTDKVTVENLAGNSNIRILDLQGRLVYKQQPVGASTTIDMGKFNKGVYLMVIESNGKIMHKKIDLI